MKVTTETTKKEFKPFVLTITIETQAELETLWHIANTIHLDEIVSEIKNKTTQSVRLDGYKRGILGKDFFDVLDEKLKELK